MKTAFPCVNYHGHKLTGMTLQDYFAAKAMQAMMTAGFWDWKNPKEDAEACYKQAKAMVEASDAA